MKIRGGITAALLLYPLFSPAQFFTEVSRQSGIDFVTYTPTLIGGGCAFFDYNNDGWLDIYIAGGMKRDKLYRNNADGTFTDVSSSAGITKPGIYTVGVVTGDIDNDGDRDIFVTTMGRDESFRNMVPNILFRNNGNGTFTDISQSAGIVHNAWSVSATLGDYNLDGFLDIYVANYVDSIRFIFDSQNEIAGFSHTGFANFLYMNNGNGTFSQVAPQLQVDNKGTSLAAAFTDYDFDHDVDIHLVNDFGEWVLPDALYRNEYPLDAFTDVSTPSGADAAIYGMGIAVGDYDEDDDLDYYLTNIGRNVLLNNSGSGIFLDTTDFAGVANTYVDSLFTTGWGAAFLDYDNDTWLDLFVANGNIPAADFIKTGEKDPNKLYKNNTDGTFSDVSVIAGVNDSSRARGLAAGDYDNDGDLDLLVTVVEEDTLNNDDWHVLLYRNDISTGNHWLKVETVGTQNNRDGFGSRVEVYSDGRKWIREIDGGSSHASQNSSIAHFGLGNEMAVDSVVVRWPGGGRFSFANVSADQLITVFESGMPNLVSHISYEICAGESVYAGGGFQSSPGVYYDTLLSSEGLDSIVISHLTVHPSYVRNSYYEICEGDSIFLDGAFWKTSAMFSDTFATAFGCDSIVVTDLAVMPLPVVIADVFLCEGDSIFAAGAWQKQDGNYYDTVPGAICDFVILTSVYVLPPVQEDTVEAVLCEGDSVFAGGGWQRTPGFYPDTFATLFGCDSVMVTQVKLLPHTTSRVSYALCRGDTLFLSHNMFTEAGIYYDSFVNENGCDSMVEITIGVDSSYLISANRSISEGDSFFVGGAWQTEPGVYTDTFASRDGCDSIVVTELMVETRITVLKGEKIILSVFPNPADSYFMVNFTLPVAGKVVIKLFSALGEEVATLFEDKREAGLLHAGFSCSDITPGIYVLAFNTDYHSTRTRIVIY
ncbi:MAG TPA: FG-GAP-like repeat-containing protein [Chitinophagales bacterium]|nr:FG-GAP-like repeat-containing protein [Chitinophagales bacterium]